MTHQWWQTLNTVRDQLNDAQINHYFIEETALFLQDVPVETEGKIKVSIQWDQLEKAYQLFSKDTYETGPIDKNQSFGSFQVVIETINVTFQCLFNHVIITDKNRLLVNIDNESYYVRSLTAYLNSPFSQMIIDHLNKLQKRLNEKNKHAWTEDAYAAWTSRFGEPKQIAEKLMTDPTNILSGLINYFPNLKGKKLMNLLGSNGLKAIAFSLLGAQAAVVDISSENARYALDVAREAGTQIDFMVADVLELKEDQLKPEYDYILMEKGILHYFIYLPPLFNIVYQLLKPGGTLILEDFHPVSVKLLSSKGKKHKVLGNYFDPSIQQVPVAFGKHLTSTQSSENQMYVYEKYWTLGEILTAVAQSNLVLTQLDEQPNIKKNDIGIPKTFILQAKKPDRE